MNRFRTKPPKMPKAQAKKYEAQLNTMLRNMMEWRGAHPTHEVLVQFNYPANTCVIAPISEALRRGVVSTNAHGWDLLKFMWPRWDDASEPTVNMYRAVLEHVPPPKRPPPTPCPHCGQMIQAGGMMKQRDDTDSNRDVTEGELNFCLHCAGVSVFKPDLTLRAQTAEEFAALPPEIQAAFTKLIETTKANPLPKRKP